MATNNMNYEITEETATSPARVIAQVEDYTDLEGADLKAANLRGADLRGAEGLPEIRLTLTQQLLKNQKEKKDESRKTWTITYLNGTPSLEVEAFSFKEAVEKVKDKLSYASLKYAYLRGANLSCADLSGADLSYVDLRGVDFKGADLSGADLSWSDLRGADLNGSDLSGASLIGAYGADLFGAKGLLGLS